MAKKYSIVVTVEAFFSALKGNPNRVAKGEGNNWPIAVYRALKKLYNEKGIKGKHNIGSMSLSISVGKVEKESPENGQPEIAKSAQSEG